ncbi:RagB/SusD family nutrient uptake outer membrane protein [Flammeovirga sp. MY04]|uniref:RagB/SusD family nutrient uptake outer membrane protein n=1 Tax=Flammeovirga sp. MY04 TaxID=1191459 RepID=UPI0008062774|nr:RagB/SusD family nutrient uptake outer membrane protein [Flammeovirga sp. MY04]ANQ52561.1 RagB/SusD family nutrient uptake outer membrane protein [Flammeovirga sp. MY04]
MKKRLLLTLFIGVIFTSCSNFLEEEVQSNLTSKNYYKNSADAETALIGVYAQLQIDGVYGQHQQYITTDITHTAFWNTKGGIGSYTMSAENSEVLLPIWKDHFTGINNANDVIDNVPNIEMDEDRKMEILGEAKFLKSLYYFNLIRYFGDVPYFEHSFTSINQDLHFSRDKVDYIYQRLIENLEFSIENLKGKGEMTVGRATKGAAQTLLSKIYLTRASMSVRDKKGDGKEDFIKAANLAMEVINSGGYKLCDYYPDAFIRENKNNDEIIFDIQYLSGIGEGNFIGIHMGIGGNVEQGGSWNNIIATDFYHTMFEESDSVRKDWNSPHCEVGFQDGEWKLRFYDENHFRDWRLAKYRRFPIRDSNYIFKDYDIHWPVFRLAEVYLIYAEAMLEIEEMPTPDIFAPLNKLRERARWTNIGDIHDDIYPRTLTYNADQLPDITAKDYPNYDALKQYIMDERGRELGGECKRWFDLVRWGKLQERIRFLENHIPEGRNNPEKQWDKVAPNIKDYHNLMPIPSVEILANPNMSQNTGY